ncbi:helix-turn-helix transcriptional regulator [Microvirga sesbaniae]|uniref:helix-turn-helix transcriptional regulator n=1 Tax=Microvirga sesbaniae TaxID=681392 RepID=UPI0021C6AB73|nr:helix-turn-helix domain-containing protein [Microvirga sp. HBU67692]
MSTQAFSPLRKKLDTPQAAEYLGLGKSTLDKLRAAGGGPTFIKIGKRVVYDPTDLDAWFAAHKRTSITESTATAA